MRLVAFSDLHLESDLDPLARDVRKVITGLESGDHLILNGDIFDLYLGDRQVYRSRFREFEREVTEATARGVRAFYLEGNHDFQLRESWGKIPGLEWSPEGVRIEVGSARFWIEHGDCADASDWGYRLMRFAFRSLPMRMFIRHGTDSQIEAVGNWFREQSRDPNLWVAERLPPAQLERLRQTFREYGRRLRELHQVDHVILGHCHDLDRDGDRYINIGYPRTHRTYVEWNSDTRTLGRADLPKA